MKKGSFVKQIFQLGIGAFINLIIGVLTTPVITRLVDPTEYGQLNLFNTYSSIVLMFFTMGLDQTLVRYYDVEQQKNYQKKLLDFCFGFPVLFAVVGSSVILLLYHITPRLFGFDHVVIWCFIINIFILILNRYGMLVLRMQYKTMMYSVMNILHKALYVAMVIPFAIWLKRQYLYILVIATLLSVLVSAGICVLSEKRFWFERITNYRLPVSKKELLRFGFPLMISSGVFILFQATDRLCLKHFGTYYDVGVYSSAQSLMAVFSIIQSTFNTLWAPKAIEHYESNPDDKQFYVRMNQIITVLMFAFGASVLVCKDIFVLMLGEKYRAASAIIPFLMFNPVMYTVSETTVTGLSIAKKTSSQVIITGVSATVNFVGNMLLIPLIGFKGAAVSTGISYIVFFTMRTLFANHYFPVNFKLRRFYLLTAFFALGSWYHMYHSFDAMIIGIYLATMALIFFLYRNTMKDIRALGMAKLKKLKRS